MVSEEPPVHVPAEFACSLRARLGFLQVPLTV